MLRKTIALSLAVLLVNALVFAPAAAAQSKAGRDSKKRVEEVRAGDARLGVGEEARVETKLRDRRKLRGFVGEASADHFVVRDSKTGAATFVEYSDVAEMKGNNLSTGAKVAIVGGVLVAAVVLFIRWAGQFK